MPLISMRGSLLCLAVLLSQSGPAGAMGLMQAYDAALQHDALYRSAVADNQAGQQNRAIGRSGLLPSVQYSNTSSKNNTDTTAPNSLGQPVTGHPRYTSVANSIALHQTLFNLDAVARFRQGIAQTNYSDALFVSRSQDLMVRLMVAYVDAKYAEDQLLLNIAQRDAFAEQRRVNERMLEKGEGTRTDLLETQSKLDLAEAQIIESEDNRTTAFDTLAAMTGREVTQLDGLAGDFRATPLAIAGLDAWQSMAREHNAELAAARFAVESAEQDIGKSRAAHAPRLDLTASYSRSMADSLANYQQDSTIRSIGLQLIVPLYSGGYASAVASQAVANRDKARSDLDASSHKVMIELRKQFNAAQSGIARMAALQKSLNSATLLVQATRQSVKGGVRINLDVLNAQQQLVAAQRDLALARYNYLISFLKLRAAAGTLERDDLRTVAGYFSAPH